MKRIVSTLIVLVLLLGVVSMVFAKNDKDNQRLTQSHKHFLKAWDSYNAKAYSNIYGQLTAATNTAHGADATLNKLLAKLRTSYDSPKARRAWEAIYKYYLKLLAPDDDDGGTGGGVPEE